MNKVEIRIMARNSTELGNVSNIVDRERDWFGGILLLYD